MSRHAFGYRFGHPFRAGGTAVSSDVPFAYDVAIGGHPYLVEWKHYQYTTVEPFRTARDFDASPGEHSLNPENTWKRNRDTWNHGGGQYYADRFGALGQLDDDNRFWQSKGVDWTQDRQLQLLHDTEQALASSATNLRVLYVGGWLYVLDGSTLRFTNAPHASPVVWTNVTLAAAGVDLTSDGNLVYIALAGGSGVYSAPLGSSSLTHMSNAAATDIATVLQYANGWLMAGVANVLTSIDATGTHQGAFTHPVTGGRWSAITGAPNAIYAAFNSADISLIYQVTVNNSTGGLNAPLMATPLPLGETVLGLGYYATRLLIGTNKGVRIGEIAADGSVALGPLLDTEMPCRCFASWEALSFFGWSNFDNVSTGLGVMRLSDLVAANQPAWSSWLMTPYASNVQGQVISLAVVDGDPWFCVSGSGVYRPAAQYVPQGWLDQGHFTFGVHEPKQWAALELVTAPLQGAIGASLENDDGTTRDLGLRSAVGSMGLGEQWSAVGMYGEQASIKLTLYRDVATGLQTPVVRRFTLRALPNPLLATKWIVPLKLYRETEAELRGTGIDEAADPGAEVNFLKELNRSLRPVEYQEGQHTYTVQVRSIDLPDAEARRQTDQRDGVEGLWFVTLVSVFTTSS